MLSKMLTTMVRYVIIPSPSPSPTGQFGFQEADSKQHTLVFCLFWVTSTSSLAQTSKKLQTECSSARQLHILGEW